jgi:hypothetical protein
MSKVLERYIPASYVIRINFPERYVTGVWFDDVGDQIVEVCRHTFSARRFRTRELAEGYRGQHQLEGEVVEVLP